MTSPNGTANVRVSIPIRFDFDSDLFDRSRTQLEELCFVADPDMHKDSVARAAQHAKAAGLHHGGMNFYANVTPCGRGFFKTVGQR